MRYAYWNKRQEDMVKLPSDTINDRRNWVFSVAKFFGVWGYKYLAKPHVECYDDLAALKKEGAVFLYTGLHKSLWETSGLLAALHLEKLEIPHVGMGDNLVRGRFFQSLARKAGIFLIKRATTRKEIVESAKALKDYIIHYMAHGVDVLFFPEGTRKSILTEGTYGKFFPTAFEAVLEYEKNKEHIQALHQGLPAYNAYIIPTNVDYSRVREDRELLEEYRKARTLHVLDSLKMIKKIRDTYITFGKPIKVANHLGKNRKELAIYSREKCLELVKILPINVVSQAILDSLRGDRVRLDNIEENITRIIQGLSRLKERFRGFSPDDHPDALLKKVSQYESTFKPRYIDSQYKPLYQLYANYIRHYL